MDSLKKLVSKKENEVDKSKCKTDGSLTSKATYEDVSESYTDEDERHVYVELCDNDQRQEETSILKVVTQLQADQTKFMSEFVNFSDEVTSQLKNLKRAVEVVDIRIQDVTKLLEETGGSRETLGDTKVHILQSIDHLGHQVMDVRREIQQLRVISSPHSASPPPPLPPPKLPPSISPKRSKEEHEFTWDVDDVDKLIRKCGHAASSSFLINTLDFKLIGSVDFGNDDHLHLKLHGEFMHQNELPKFGTFECSVSAVSKSADKAQFQLGKIVAGFSSILRQNCWIAGNVPVEDLRTKGFVGLGSGRALTLRLDVTVTR